MGKHDGYGMSLGFSLCPCRPPATVANSALCSKISTISYLFDAFPPAATLSALTIAASMRLLVAAAIPLVIIQDITKLGGGWAYGIFGFVAIALMVLPFLGYKWGSEARAKSRYNREQKMEMEKKSVSREESHGSEGEIMGAGQV